MTMILGIQSFGVLSGVKYLAAPVVAVFLSAALGPTFPLTLVAASL